MLDRIHPRVFAGLLIVGSFIALATVVLAVWSVVAQLDALTWLILCVMVSILLLSIAVGISLWRGGDLGKDGATYLFAAQVPVIQIPFFQYGWFTGVTASVITRFGEGDTLTNIGMTIGGSFVFLLRPPQGQYVIGVNLFAVFAVIALRRARMLRKSTTPSDVHEVETIAKSDS